METNINQTFFEGTNDTVAYSIFLPYKIMKNLSQVYLFGHRNNGSSSKIVNCKFAKECNEFDVDLLHKKSSFNAQSTDADCVLKLEFIGILYVSRTYKTFYHIPKNASSFWFILRYSNLFNYFKLDKLYIDSVQKCASTRFIFYDSYELLSSQILPLHDQTNITSFIIKSLTSDDNTSVICDVQKPNSNSFNCFVDHLKQHFNIVMAVFYVICKNLMQVIDWTHVGRQFHQRALQMKEIILNCNKESAKTLKCSNLIFVILFDIFLGWLITFAIWQSELPVELLNITIQYSNGIVMELKKLLYWLMGVPGGLKLNIPLNNALGHFFLYHIYLWEAYIAIVIPVFSVILKFSTVIGFIGLTFFLSLMSDLFSIATVHIYCFYGYATRLYGYQVSSLSALWRLFRGKKWNPLRQRVDSHDYDSHQLFLGTLIFTVLLFLLPTVLVYYFVFTSLRILVLVFQGLVFQLIEFLTVFPQYSLILKIMNSSKIAGDVHFSIYNYQDAMMLSMQTIQAPLSIVLEHSRLEVYVKKRTMAWREIFTHILHGNLIYPL